MYLEHLTLNGFKSFANKTTLDFKPAIAHGRAGITAIVGPNGSGKSNVVDAMRWVLGEQSSKQLRGKKSGDVIFAGSDKKSRVGAARVSLKLNNEDSAIDIDYSEVELTRELFRSGESGYLINEQKSRLQDIHYLLAQAHIGQRSYTVIGQGMIGKVLNSTPLERKEFFDEAAGIKQYQIKKDKAVTKLSTARDNLQSAQLQLSEITPRLKSLDRQMKRFAEREHILGELDQKLTLFYAIQWQQLTESMQAELDRKLALEQQRDAFQTEITTLQADMAELATNDQLNELTTLQQQHKQLLYKKNELTRERAEWQGRLDAHWSQSGEHSLIMYQQQADALERDITAIKQELTATYETVTTTSTREQQLSKQYKELLEKISQAREKLFTHIDPHNENAVQSLMELRATLDGIVADFEQQLTAITTETNTSQLKEQLQTIVSKFRHSIKQLPENNNRKELSTWRERLVTHEQQKAILDTDLLELRSQIKFLTQRRQALTSSITDKEQALGQLHQQLNQAKDNSTPDQQQSEIAKRLEDLDTKRTALDESITQLEQQIADISAHEQGKKQALFELQQQGSQKQQELNSISQHITTHEIQLARIQTKQEDLKHASTQDFSESWNDLTDSWTNYSLPSDHNLAQLEQDIQQLKRKKELIGAIDEETRQEHTETKERHEWLTAQTTDLDEAIGSLEHIIADLDKKIDTQFSANIKKINEKFSHYFAVLFNGGKAELQLTTQDTSSENEDEATNQVITGIEIAATPPGKKLQSISVLSGGEKALTSIALICAIIANNNSPFVVLDEVDAALDEANSARFASILEELSDKTQFVVVTHNRATMEKAQLLYGVTMGDDGVSTLLSIKLEEGQRFANR